LRTPVRGRQPDPSGDLSDNWVESFVRPAISGTARAGKGEFFTKVSAVGERTYAAPPPLVGEEASSFKVEDLHLGWRSGTALSIGENALEFTVGRARYTIGHGLLLWDGGGEGGSRGGFWSNARKAWEFTGLARFNAKRNTLEAFYLDRDEIPEGETGTRVWGGNYERTVGSATTLGASYLHFMADSSRPARDGMNVLTCAPHRAVAQIAGLSARRSTRAKTTATSSSPPPEPPRRLRAVQSILEAQDLLPVRVLPRR
jgi:hypothetical protein